MKKALEMKCYEKTERGDSGALDEVRLVAVNPSQMGRVTQESTMDLELKRFESKEFEAGRRYRVTIEDLEGLH